jgi:hypothetical protein
MSISYVHHQLSGSPLRGSRGIQGTFKALRARTEPGPPVPLLAAGVTEGGGAYQRLARIRPAIGVGLVGIVPLQGGAQLGRKVFARTKIAPFEETTCQDTEPSRDLVEPRAMGGRKMEDMLMHGITQKGAPLAAVLQSLGRPGECAP